MERIIDSELKEARLLLKAHDHCIDEDRAEKLMTLAKKIVAPYLEIRNPKALWLESNMIGYGGDSGMSRKEFDILWLELIKESSDGNCAEAQYDYGCHLYELQEYAEAVELYRLSACQGYKYAQWCFGLDILNGIGVLKDENMGLHYIRLAAEQRYSYAIEFMVDNCKENKYGLEAAETEKWLLILSQSE